MTAWLVRRYSLLLMTRLPKRPLPIPTKEKILENFTIFLNSLEGRREFDDFCLFFLSRTERLVLAKRLQIAIFLIKGYDYQRIGKALDTSAGTISRISEMLRKQGEIAKLIDEVFIAPQKRAKEQEENDKKLKEGSALFKTPTLGKNLEKAIFGDK